MNVKTNNQKTGQLSTSQLMAEDDRKAQWDAVKVYRELILIEFGFVKLSDAQRQKLAEAMRTLGLTTADFDRDLGILAQAKSLEIQIRPRNEIEALDAERMRLGEQIKELEKQLLEKQREINRISGITGNNEIIAGQLKRKKANNPRLWGDSIPPKPGQPAVNKKPQPGDKNYVEPPPFFYEGFFDQ